MSWMDSWSRPGKSQAVPAPFYLTNLDVAYCHTCGRVTSSRRVHASTSKASPQKEEPRCCSARCRHSKPKRTPGSADIRAEEAFVALLDGRPIPKQCYHASYQHDEKPLDRGNGSVGAYKKRKGETRITVMCSDVENIVFGPRDRDDFSQEQSEKGYPEDTMAGVQDVADNSLELEEDVDPRMLMTTGSRIRATQEISLVNGSVGGEKGRKERIDETPEMLAKREAGTRLAKERELIRCVARRGCAFGFRIHEVAEPREGKHRRKASKEHKDIEPSEARERTKWRKCEAVMNEAVVEASFAKGEWGIRWRE